MTMGGSIYTVAGNHLEHRHGMKGLVSHTNNVSGHASIYQPLIGQLHQLTVYLQANTFPSLKVLVIH